MLLQYLPRDALALISFSALISVALCLLVFGL
jgi:hypothetical protein